MDLYDYQDQAVTSVIDFLNQSQGNPLVSSPTGSGKSVMIAFLVKAVMQSFPGLRVLMTVHQKELVDQNYKTLKLVWPEAPCGIHSASLGQKKTKDPIIFGQIQSMYAKAMHFGFRNILIVDEAHMIPHKAEGTYRRFIDELLVINPNLRVIGFTATPFRLKGGYITDNSYGDPIFTEICFKIDVNELIDRGKLCDIITAKPDVTYSTDNVAVGSSGEFVAKSLAASIEAQVNITEAAVNQIVREGVDRKKWLIFTPSVKNAIVVNDLIRESGVVSEVVCGATPKKERAKILSYYESGRIKSVVNAMLYTTGIDVPGIDLVALLRSTMSPALYQQMIGRGMRVLLGKLNTLVLDFGGNIARHGPIDNIKIKKRPAKRVQSSQGMPEKQCLSCLNMMPIQQKECLNCGFIFPEKPKHSDFASSDAILTCNRRFTVKKVEYSAYQAMSGKYRLLVKYTCHSSTVRVFREYVCLGDDGWSGKQAIKWLRQRSAGGDSLVMDGMCKGAESTKFFIDSVIVLIRKGWLIDPIVIRIDDLKKEYPAVVNYEFGER